MRRLFHFAVVMTSFLILQLVPNRVGADLILNPTYVNGGGQVWNSVTQGVVNQAMNDWTAVLSGISNGGGGSTSVTVNFDVSFANAGTNSYLGQWQGGFSAAAGASIRPWTAGVNHTILFHADFLSTNLANKLWFDPTPGDNGSDKAFADWDAVTVMRHEIGHMLGFTGLYRDNFDLPNQSFPWTGLITNNVFDPTGLNVAMEPGDPAHVLADALLMDTSLSNAEGRIGISSLETEMLVRAYGYTVTAVPEPASILLILVVSPFGFRMFRRQIFL